MANNRPIRRGRIPFRRGGRWMGKSKLSTRWIDGNSSRAVTGQCPMDGKDLFCDPDESPTQLLYGDADWDWADNNEVRIDRILGTISWDYVNQHTGTEAVCPIPVAVRLGILAVEETAGSAPTIDLFDPENLEEYEWMWLYHSSGVLTCGGSTHLRQNDNISVDTRTRRKLGKQDSVWLYGQFKFNSSIDGGCVGLGRTPRVHWMLRTIIRS